MNLRAALVALAAFLSAALLLLMLPVFNVPLVAVNSSGKNVSAMAHCGLDSDCGVSGFTGIYACRNSGIFGEYVTRLCLKAGGADSGCAVFTSMEFVSVCFEPEECVPGSGECRRKATTTVVSRLVAPQSYYASLSTTTTTLSDVACVRNTSCGIDHYGKPYCSGSGHAVRDYVAYACLNPGTHASRCTREKTTYLVDYCGAGEACVMGECVDKRHLDWYCVREDCCDTDFSVCADTPVRFLPFPVRGFDNGTYYLWHNTTVYQ
jgi:hypothetical protein